MVLVHALSHCFAEPHLVLAVSSVCRRKGHWLRGFGNGCSFWVLTSHCMLWYLTGCCFIYVLHWGNLAHVLAASLHGSWARSLSALPIPRSIAQGEQMSLLSEACYMCRILLFCLCRIDQLRGDKVTGLCLFPVYLEHWRDSNALMPCTISDFSLIWESACKHFWFKLIKSFAFLLHSSYFKEPHTSGRCLYVSSGGCALCKECSDTVVQWSQAGTYWNTHILFCFKALSLEESFLKSILLSLNTKQINGSVWPGSALSQDFALCLVTVSLPLPCGCAL